jgi:hypothetical protein
MRIDGQSLSLSGFGSGSGNIFDSNHLFALGWSNESIDRYWKGEIAHASMWDRSLNAAEINDVEKFLLDRYKIQESSSSEELSEPVSFSSSSTELSETSTSSSNTSSGSSDSSSVNSSSSSSSQSDFSTSSFIGSKAAQFTAANSEYLESPNTDNHNISANDSDFTVAGWVRLDSNPAVAEFIAKWRNGSSGNMDYSLRHVASGNQWRFKVGIGPGASPSANVTSVPLVIGDWYFVAGRRVHSTGEVTSYVNGSSSSVTRVGSVNSGDEPFRIGATRETIITRFMDGRIQYVSLWNRAVSDEELDELYNNGDALHFDDWTAQHKDCLQAFYKLNEASARS